MQHFPDLIQNIVENFPDVKKIPLQWKAIPADVVIKDLTTAKNWFIWGYGISLFFCLFLYGLYKRREGQHASAFAYKNAAERQIIIQGLEKQDKTATIQLKWQTLREQELDTEKKRISYAMELSTLLANTLQPDADDTTRVMLIKHYIPALQHNH